MNDEFDPARVSQALSQLTADEPALGFTPREVVTAGRSRRRRRNLAVAGMSMAAAVAVVAAIGVPATMWSSVGSAPPNQVGTSVQPSLASPSPAASASPEPSGNPVCARPTDVQWNAHLAFGAQLRGALPTISGNLTSDINREDTACVAVGDVWREGRFKVTRGKSVGSVGATVSTGPPGSYRNMDTNDPCKGVPATGSCSIIRRAGAIIQVSRSTRNDGQTEPSKSIHVTAIWPDNTAVITFASTIAHHEQMPPQLPSVPLTEAQLIDLALDPQLRE